MKQSIRSNSVRPSSASVRSTKSNAVAKEMNVNISKREKLKTLLIQKFQKKFPMLNYEFLLEKVSTFIQSAKLTESDLINFEEKLRIWASNKSQEEKVKKIFDPEPEIKETLRNNFTCPIERADSVSHMSEVQSVFKESQRGSNLKYEEITDFGLRKLLQTQRQPLKKQELEKYPDEWTAIADYKNKLWEETKKSVKLQDKLKKDETRHIYKSQIREKEDKKLENELTNRIHHRTLMHNLEKENIEEKKKSHHMKEKMKIVKEMQDQQMRDNTERKMNEFLKSRDYDNKLIKNVLEQNQKTKDNDIRKKEEAKANLQQMLKENEEFKIKQEEEKRKERELDIKFMQDYTKILDKQEQDRVEYFKRCENRQMEFMNRMAETVVKQQDNKIKEEEEKMLQHQKQKDLKDLEEEERRKKYLSNSKMNMRSFLNNQISQKKILAQNEKLLETEQLKLWNDENQRYFHKEKENAERIKMKNKNNAEFLKTQFKTKTSYITKMNEEEYRMNRDLLDVVVSRPSNTQNNFLI